MPGFKGSYRHTIDQKGRINIPAKFRRLPGPVESYVITRGLDECLYIYPQDEWEKVEQKLRTLAQTDPNSRRYLRSTLTYTEDVQIDSQGRITIPPKLIKFVGLTKDVLINGALDRMELWNPETFEKYISGDGESYEEVAAKTLL